MIFQIEPMENNELEQVYERAMEELGEFYGFTWGRNRPQIIILNDRKAIDKIKGTKTEPWLVGFAMRGSIVYLLKKENFATESSHVYSDEKYAALLKHELAHLFFQIASKNQKAPVWLNEGVSLYLADQLKWKKQPEKFESFLDFASNGGKGVYSESGFVIKLLVEKFGKEKLIELIKSPNEFSKIFGFDLTFEKINELL